MTPFTEFAPAKINLALHVLGRRDDGLHELDSTVAFADLGDELRIEPASEFVITAEGPFAGSLPAQENNIILAAWKAAAEIAAARGFRLPPVSVHLVKNLPVSAGIGGGSADAAAAMRGFLRMAGIADIDEEIARAALALGADVPVCLVGKACRMQGAGERVTPIENFKPLHAVLINPLIAIQTSTVFQILGLEIGQRHGAPRSPSPLWGGIKGGGRSGITTRPPPLAPPHKGEGEHEDYSDPAAWRNDLTISAVALVPAIADVIAELENQQHLCFARMSGSGATCFGVFENLDAAGEAAKVVSASHAQWWVRQANLS
jgi:4-diphosphocytidyl-2-C-methyl-D-erythritol kinase